MNKLKVTPWLKQVYCYSSSRCLMWQATDLLQELKQLSGEPEIHEEKKKDFQHDSIVSICEHLRKARKIFNMTQQSVSQINCNFLSTHLKWHNLKCLLYYGPHHSNSQAKFHHTNILMNQTTWWSMCKKHFIQEMQSRLNCMTWTRSGNISYLVTSNFIVLFVKILSHFTVTALFCSYVEGQ
jgi:arsenate reductase-like glutaredoxin family protein